MRSLAPDEAALWARVTATIRPLSRAIIERPEAAIEPAKAEPPAAKPPKAGLRPAPSRAVRPPEPAIGNTLDGSWDRKLGAGSITPDRVIDLHGHNLERAWTAIDRGIEAAIDRGERVVLLVTGHARPGEPPVERGKIRAAVNDWLAASRHACKIAAVRGAHRRHGGGGSLYLVLRRN